MRRFLDNRRDDLAILLGLVFLFLAALAPPTLLFLALAGRLE